MTEIFDKGGRAVGKLSSGNFKSDVGRFSGEGYYSDGSYAGSFSTESDLLSDIGGIAFLAGLPLLIATAFVCLGIFWGIALSPIWAPPVLIVVAFRIVLKKLHPALWATLVVGLIILNIFTSAAIGFIYQQVRIRQVVDTACEEANANLDNPRLNNPIEYNLIYSGYLWSKEVQAGGYSRMGRGSRGEVFSVTVLNYSDGGGWLRENIDMRVLKFWSLIKPVSFSALCAYGTAGTPLDWG